MIHAAQRLQERAGVTMPDIVIRDLYKALASPEKYYEYIEFVKKLSSGAGMYRFRIESGIFYVIEVNGRPATILTQSMARSKKFASKKTSKLGSTRQKLKRADLRPRP